MGKEIEPAGGRAAHLQGWRGRPGKHLRRGMLHGALLLGVILVLAPFGWALVAVLGPGPRPWTAFAEALRAAPLARYLVNSLIVSGLTTFGQVLTAALAAFVFARLYFPGRDLLFLLFLASLMIPKHVTMLPTFVLLGRLGWLDSYAALIVPALAYPFGVFVLRQYFLTIPTELEDAARLDGSSRLGVLWHVILPLSRPALATVALFSFLWSWNSFLWPLMVLQTPERYTLPVGLSMMRSEVGADWPVVMAGALLAALPIVLLFLALQRWLWRGVGLMHDEG